MIKKVIGITTLLFLTVFLIMPVYASEPDPFEKITDVYPGDLDYRNSLVDWNGYNLDFDIYWNKQGGLPPDTHRLFVYENETVIYRLSTWDYDADLDLYKLRLTTAERSKILNIMFSRNYNTGNRLYFNARTLDTDAFLLEVRITFQTLLNINLGSIYIADSLNQSNVGLLSAFTTTIDIIGLENTIGGGNATFIMDRLTLETESTHPIGTGSIANGLQLAQYNFINKYTNVHAIYYNFVISANAYDPETAITAYYIYQLGFFADTQVILPDLDIDTDFQIYEPTICSILDLACISRNLIGELSNTVYNRLGADSIASSILDIYDTLFYPVYIIENSAWQNAVLAIYVMLPIGIIVMIIKRVT